MNTINQINLIRDVDYVGYSSDKEFVESPKFQQNDVIEDDVPDLEEELEDTKGSNKIITIVMMIAIFAALIWLLLFILGNFTMYDATK